MLLTLVPAPRSADIDKWPADSADPTVALAVPVGLVDRRTRAQDAVRAVVEAPVRHVSAALLEALQGSWGTPEEVLGSAVAPRRLAVAH